MKSSEANLYSYMVGGTWRESWEGQCVTVAGVLQWYRLYGGLRWYKPNDGLIPAPFGDRWIGVKWFRVACDDRGLAVDSLYMLHDERGFMVDWFTVSCDDRATMMDWFQVSCDRDITVDTFSVSRGDWSLLWAGFRMCRRERLYGGLMPYALRTGPDVGLISPFLTLFEALESAHLSYQMMIEKLLWTHFRCLLMA
jgi:hypothetical protein